jgi:hypothetical protein
MSQGAAFGKIGPGLFLVMHMTQVELPPGGGLGIGCQQDRSNKEKNEEAADFQACHPGKGFSQLFVLPPVKTIKQEAIYRKANDLSTVPVSQALAISSSASP